MTRRDDDYWDEPHYIPSGEPIDGRDSSSRIAPTVGTIAGIFDGADPNAPKRPHRTRKIGFRRPETETHS